MRKQRSNRLALMLSDEEVAKVQDFRFANRVGSQSSAVRQLIERGLEVTNEKGPAATAIAPDHDQNPTSQKDGGIDA